MLDAVAQLEFSPKFNVWFGRFLPPSDRANLYGPYYSHHWAVYTDGVQDGYPFIFQGRDNGVAYWGQFGKVKVPAVHSTAPSATTDDTVISAGRVQVDFWDPEDGYYLNGTYYGDKNLLAIGVAGQAQGGDKSAYSADFLLERKVKGGGAVLVRSGVGEVRRAGRLQRQLQHQRRRLPARRVSVSAGWSGPGRFEVLGKYAHARFRDGIRPLDFDYDQDTTEIDVNYVIKQFNARVMMFFKDTSFDAVRTDFMQFGVGLQLQM